MLCLDLSQPFRYAEVGVVLGFTAGEWTFVFIAARQQGQTTVRGLALRVFPWEEISLYPPKRKHNIRIRVYLPSTNIFRYTVCKCNGGVNTVCKCNGGVTDVVSELPSATTTSYAKEKLAIR